MKLAAKGVELLYVEEDARGHGIQPTDLVGKPKSISRKELAPLLARYDLVFTW